MGEHFPSPPPMEFSDAPKIDEVVMPDGTVYRVASDPEPACTPESFTFDMYACAEIRYGSRPGECTRVATLYGLDHLGNVLWVVDASRCLVRFDRSPTGEEG